VDVVTIAREAQVGLCANSLREHRNPRASGNWRSFQRRVREAHGRS